MYCTVISGTGSYIPPLIKTNADFTTHTFFSEEQQPLDTVPEEVVKKFREITGIEERRYTTGDLNASDIGAIAAAQALTETNTDPETIDQLIVAHNFGNVLMHYIQSDAVPSLASHIKHKLGIRNNNCVAYDILFGCPGWLQGVIQADAFFKAGIAKKALVVGTETLSRVIDPHDRNSMIFSDGAGASLLEYVKTDGPSMGIISSAVQSFTNTEVDFINMGSAFYPGSDPHIRYIKMKGRKVYEFAMSKVPAAMKDCLDKCGVHIREVKKIFIHQANKKMDDGMIKRLYQLYGISEHPENIMPMSIHWLGNSSVATIPTLFDLVRKNKIPEHQLHAGDIILFASVGAGMNVNAVCYRYI